MKELLASVQSFGTKKIRREFDFGFVLFVLVISTIPLAALVTLYA